MSDLLQVLPKFSTGPFAHILPSIEKSAILTCDLITLSPQETAKRAQIPTAEAAKFSAAIVNAIRKDVISQAERPALEFEDNEPGKFISTLDSNLDAELSGGIRPGYVTEITGESGVGKTQFLLTLLLSAQLVSSKEDEPKSTIYISTEAALSTSRLNQLLLNHPVLSSLSLKERPTLDRVLSIQTGDLESQEHILRYQVPVAIRRRNVGLVIVDSIAANYRAEFERIEKSDASSKSSKQNPAPKEGRAGRSLIDRKAQLIQLGALLRYTAWSENVAIVLANQISDRFDAPTYVPLSAPPPSATPTISPDPLLLDHQQRWFTGWGDLPIHLPGHSNLKTPTLGIVWTNQLAARIALVKENHGIGANDKRRRWMRVAFSSWGGATNGVGIEYDITLEGIKSVNTQDPAANI